MAITSKHGGYTAGLINASTQTGAVTAPTASTTTLPVTVDASGDPTSNKVIIPTHIGTQIQLMFWGDDTDGDEIRFQIAVVDNLNDVADGTRTVEYLFRSILIFDGLLCTYTGATNGVINTDLVVDTITPVGSYQIADVPRIFDAANDGPTANT